MIENTLFSNKPEKLAISFWIWGLWGDVYQDYDLRMKELKERGFNCIRTESGAGLVCNTRKEPRGTVNINVPFGEYTKNIRQMDSTIHSSRLNALDRLTEMFRAAEKNDVYIVLSTWYYLHSNWFYDNEINDELLNLTSEEKFEYFSDELDRILAHLRKNNLIHRVAYAEIFNEIDGVFKGRTDEYELHIRGLHEKAIDKLKKNNPDVLFACDVIGAYVPEKFLPRNADIINYHCYYAWGAYDIFENGTLSLPVSSKDIPEKTKKYLNKVIYPDDVIKTYSGRHVEVDDNWKWRVALYSSIDPNKISGLEALIEKYFEAHIHDYKKVLETEAKKIAEVRDRCVPNARIVMGEGVTYCTSSKLHFEEKSDLYFDLMLYQSEILRQNGIWGTVARTTSGPEDLSWECRKDDYVRVNRRFLKGE